MTSSTSDYQLPNYSDIENDLLEIPKITMLDSVKHLIDGIHKEVRRKEWTINTNKEILIKGKDEAIEGLRREIAELEKVLDLIPDVKYVKEQNELPRLYRRDNPLVTAREWIAEQIEYRRSVEKEKEAAFMEKMSANPTPTPDLEQYLKDTHKDLAQQIEDLKEILQQHKKRNVALELKLSNVQNNQLETSIIFLPNRNGKLVSLKKQVELGKISSGTLLNTVINIPAGYELEKVILRKAK